MEANKPYIINVTSDFTSGTINGVNIAKADATQTVGDWTATGLYTYGKVPAASYFFNTNKIIKAEDDSNEISALNAYFTNTAADKVTYTVDGAATAINGIVANDSASADEVIYNIAGQRVSKPTRGIYIINGQKVIMK